MANQRLTWGQGRKADFADKMHHEITQTLGARQALETQWRRWLELYRAPATQPIKSFPYEGASNAMLPLIATDVDQLYAKFIQTIQAPKNIWSVSPRNERWIEAAKPMEDYLTMLDHSLLDMKSVNEKVFLEMTKLGTGIYKTGWYFEQRKVKQYDGNGVLVDVEKRVAYPSVDHVRLIDFLLPAYAYSIDPDAQGGAWWVAERLEVRPEKLKGWAKAEEPWLPGMDSEGITDVLNYIEKRQLDYDTTIRHQDYEKRGLSTGGTPITATDEDFDRDRQTTTSLSQGDPLVEKVTLWEIHARYETQKGQHNDIVVTYHIPTRRILRAILNPYDHGKRPYEVVRYFPGDGFYGIGVCEQKEPFQNLQSELFNYQMDNVLLTNSRGIVAREGGNIMPGEPIYPWKIWFTQGDPRAEFDSFQMADIYPSLPQTYDLLNSIGERRSSIGDLQLGNLQSLPSRTPATTTQALLEEGARRPDLTLKDIRRGLGRVGLRLIQLSQQFISSPRSDELGGMSLMEISVQSLGMPEGARLAEKLIVPLENAELGIGVDVTATSATQNKELAKQSLMGLLQLEAQLAPQFVQLMQISEEMQGSQTGQVALESAVGMAKLFTRLLEQHDIRDPEQIAPDVQAAPAQGAGGVPGFNGGPAGGPGAAQGVGGLAGLLGGAG